MFTRLPWRGFCGRPLSFVMAVVYSGPCHLPISTMIILFRAHWDGIYIGVTRNSLNSKIANSFIHPYPRGFKNFISLKYKLGSIRNWIMENKYTYCTVSDAFCLQIRLNRMIYCKANALLLHLNVELTWRKIIAVVLTSTNNQRWTLSDSQTVATPHFFYPICFHWSYPLKRY